MGRARLQLALQSIELDGKQYEIRTAYSHRIGGNHKKRNFAWIGGGAGGGLLIGALAAGGKGALIGGPIGAGAGTAVTRSFSAWRAGETCPEGGVAPAALLTNLAAIPPETNVQLFSEPPLGSICLGVRHEVR
jgi:hypothetical protein